MNKIYLNIFTILLFCFLSAQNSSLYLETANELKVRKKLSDKLPDVFDQSKFIEIVKKLDAIAQITPLTHNDRLKIDNPEYHWCFSQAYLLKGRATESLDHYRKYKILIKQGIYSPHPLFNNPISELELSLENQQANLAQDIYKTINIFKKLEFEPQSNQILILQNKLNAYNELSVSTNIISTDGVIGPETKSAIYDFEENNPYFTSEDEISNANNTSLEIMSLPSSIRPVSKIPGIENQNLSPDNNLALNNIDLSKSIIIDSDKIKSIPGNSLAEILEHLLGINVRRSGVSDALASISTIGGTSEQTLILVDGLKISNQQTLHHDLDLPININDIKQIEVTQNACARKYGTGAVSGIINIITKNGDTQKSYISSEMGDYSLLNGNIGINLPIGKSFHGISYSDFYSSGYKANTDFIKRTFYYKYSLKDGRSSTDFSFGYLLRGNGVSNYLSNIYANQYEKNTTKFFNSKILWNFDQITLESNMHWYDHTDELALDKNVSGWDHYSNNEIGINFNTDLLWELGNTQPSFSYNREINSNTNLKEIARNHYSLSLQHNFKFNKILLNLGVSGNYYNDFGWITAPGYQIIYNINNNANIYHQYDYGFRLPSFYEMNAQDYMFSGNNSIVKETINSYENGMQLYGSGMTLTLSQFYKNSENVIDWHYTGSAWQSTNIPDVITSGHNIRLQLYPEIIKLLRFINNFEVGYAFIDIEHNGIHDNYKNISNFLKHQLIYSMQYKLPFSFSQSWHVRYEQPAMFDNRTIIDTQIHHKIWRIESTINISNLLDVEYEDIKGILLPGRWVRFNLRFNL